MRKERPPRGSTGRKVFSPEIIPPIGHSRKESGRWQQQIQAEKSVKYLKRKRQSSPMGIGMLGCLLIQRCVECSAYFATSKALLWFCAGIRGEFFVRVNSFFPRLNRFGHPLGLKSRIENVVAFLLKACGRPTKIPRNICRPVFRKATSCSLVRHAPS
jgi:hypothetical protein